MTDSTMISIASGLGVGIALWWSAHRGAKLEPQITEALRKTPDLTATQLAERVGLGSGWFATNKIIQALQPMIGRKEVIQVVPDGVSMMRRVRETRHRLTR